MIDEINIPEWEDKYNLGIPEIDLQHQYFLKLIKRIYEKIDSQTPVDLIDSHLNEIVYYGRFHFCSEENLMRLYKYPDYLNMKEIHNRLIHKTANMITLYKLDKIEIKDIILFLVNWFSSHTAKEDKKMAEYILNSK